MKAVKTLYCVRATLPGGTASATIGVYDAHTPSEAISEAKIDARIEGYDVKTLQFAVERVQQTERKKRRSVLLAS